MAQRVTPARYVMASLSKRVAMFSAAQTVEVPCRTWSGMHGADCPGVKPGCDTTGFETRCGRSGSG